MRTITFTYQINWTVINGDWQLKFYIVKTVRYKYWTLDIEKLLKGKGELKSSLFLQIHEIFNFENTILDTKFFLQVFCRSFVLKAIYGKENFNVGYIWIWIIFLMLLIREWIYNI